MLQFRSKRIGLISRKKRANGIWNVDWACKGFDFQRFNLFCSFVFIPSNPFTASRSFSSRLRPFLRLNFSVKALTIAWRGWWQRRCWNEVKQKDSEIEDEQIHFHSSACGYSVIIIEEDQTKQSNHCKWLRVVSTVKHQYHYNWFDL